MIWVIIPVPNESETIGAVVEFWTGQLCGFGMQAMQACVLRTHRRMRLALLLLQRQHHRRPLRTASPAYGGAEFEQVLARQAKWLEEVEKAVARTE